MWPRSATGIVPLEWIRFAGNSKLLRRELYPELFNAFLACDFLGPGQRLFLSGFPGRSRYVSAAPAGGGGERGWEEQHHHMDVIGNRVLQVQPWDADELPITKAMERADPDLYHRVYYVMHVPPRAPGEAPGALHGEWVEAKNDISEADLRMFYFDHFFQHEHIIFHLNDGDVFSIGLLYAYERIAGIAPVLDNQTGLHTGHVKYMFRNWHTVCMPYKLTIKEEEQAAEREHLKLNHGRAEEFIDLDMMYNLVQSYPRFKEARVSNHVAMLVFMLIMAGTDFYTKLYGMGMQKVVWKVLFDKLELFTHMVQLSESLPPCTRTKRTIVLDEDAFIQFVHFCYLEKHGGSAAKAKANKAKDARAHMPDQNAIRVRARSVLWNLLYWKNGPLGHVPNCFELWYDVPYFPYYRPPRSKAVLCNVVASRPKPVDEIYAQHMRNPVVAIRAPQRAQGANAVQATGRIQRVVDAFTQGAAASNK